MNIPKMLSLCVLLASTMQTAWGMMSKPSAPPAASRQNSTYNQPQVSNTPPPTYMSSPESIAQFIDDAKNNRPLNDKNNPCLAWNAYAAGVQENNVALLKILEQNQVPIPDANNVTFMMRHYALPFSIIDPSIAQKPKAEALCWCIEHGANSNGTYNLQNVPYKPKRPEHYDTSGAPHPLLHLVEYLNEQSVITAFSVLKNRGSSLCGDKSRECALLVERLRKRCTYKFAHKVEFTPVAYIFAAYKDITPDKETADAIFYVAHRSSDSNYVDSATQAEAKSLMEDIFPYTTAYHNRKAAEAAIKTSGSIPSKLRSFFSI